MVRKRYTVAIVGLEGLSAAQRSEVSRHRRERDAMASAAEERERLAVIYGSAARKYHIVVESDGEVIHRISMDQMNLRGSDDLDVMVSRPDGETDETADISASDADEPEVRETTGEYPLIDPDMDVALDPLEPGDVEEQVVEARHEEPSAQEPVADDVRAIEDDVADGDTRGVPTSDPSTTPSADQEPEMFEPASTTLSETSSRGEGSRRMPTWDDVPSGPVPEEVLRYFESALAREEARDARRRNDLDAA